MRTLIITTPSPELLKRFDVGIIYCSPLMFKKVDPALELLRRSIYMTGIPIGQLASGNKLQVGTGGNHPSSPSTCR